MADPRILHVVVLYGTENPIMTMGIILQRSPLRFYFRHHLLPFHAQPLDRMVPTFESVDEILKCDHSNESY